MGVGKVKKLLLLLAVIASVTANEWRSDGEEGLLNSRKWHLLGRPARTPSSHRSAHSGHRSHRRSSAYRSRSYSSPTMHLPPIRYADPGEAPPANEDLGSLLKEYEQLRDDVQQLEKHLELTEATSKQPQHFRHPVLDSSLFTSPVTAPPPPKAPPTIRSTIPPTQKPSTTPEPTTTLEPSTTTELSSPTRTLRKGKLHKNRFDDFRLEENPAWRESTILDAIQRGQVYILKANKQGGHKKLHLQKLDVTPRPSFRREHFFDENERRMGHETPKSEISPTVREEDIYNADDEFSRPDEDEVPQKSGRHSYRELTPLVNPREGNNDQIKDILQPSTQRNSNALRKRRLYSHSSAPPQTKVLASEEYFSRHSSPLRPLAPASSPVSLPERRKQLSISQPLAPISQDYSLPRFSTKSPRTPFYSTVSSDLPSTISASPASPLSKSERSFLQQLQALFPNDPSLASKFDDYRTRVANVAATSVGTSASLFSATTSPVPPLSPERFSGSPHPLVPERLSGSPHPPLVPEMFSKSPDPHVLPEIFSMSPDSLLPERFSVSPKPLYTAVFTSSPSTNRNRQLFINEKGELVDAQGNLLNLAAQFPVVPTTPTLSAAPSSAVFPATQPATTQATVILVTESSTLLPTTTSTPSTTVTTSVTTPPTTSSTTTSTEPPTTTSSSTSTTTSPSPIKAPITKPPPSSGNAAPVFERFSTWEVPPGVGDQLFRSKSEFANQALPSPKPDIPSDAIVLVDPNKKPNDPPTILQLPANIPPFPAQHLNSQYYSPPSYPPPPLPYSSYPYAPPPPQYQPPYPPPAYPSYGQFSAPHFNQYPPGAFNQYPVSSTPHPLSAYFSRESPLTAAGGVASHQKGISRQEVAALLAQFYANPQNRRRAL